MTVRDLLELLHGVPLDSTIDMVQCFDAASGDELSCVGVAFDGCISAQLELGDKGAFHVTLIAKGEDLHTEVTNTDNDECL
ncbi:MAG: hypothetical protein ACI4EA_04595 [Candidatus Ornithomonoglobus sp.]